MRNTGFASKTGWEYSVGTASCFARAKYVVGPFRGERSAVSYARKHRRQFPGKCCFVEKRRPFLSCDCDLCAWVHRHPLIADS